MRLALAAVLAVGLGPGSADLRAHCPVHFEQRADGGCYLVSFYQRYDAPPGFGGMRVPLPEPRQGFRPELIDLGRLLFFDPVLSGDRTISCAHCHRPDRALADGRARSVARGAEGVRNAPALWNLAFSRRLFRDGRARSLEEQAEAALLSPGEMAQSAAGLEAALAATPYPGLFARAGLVEPGARVGVEHVTRALAAFQSTLVSLHSRYDRYAHGETDALDATEREGHALFRSFVTRCAQCHVPPLFSNDQLAVIGSPEPADRPLDPGAQAVSGRPEDRGAFRVPSLRNVARTAPYMHSGRFASLRDVVGFYNERRGHAVPAGERLRIHWNVHLEGPELSEREEAALVAFLRTLDDLSALPDVPASVPSGLEVAPR